MDKSIAIENELLTAGQRVPNRQGDIFTMQNNLNRVNGPNREAGQRQESDRKVPNFEIWSGY